MFDTVFVTSKQDFRGFDREEDQKEQHPENAPVLDEAARDKMAQLQYVTEVEPEIRVMGEIVYRRPDALWICHRPAHVGARERSLRQSSGKFFSGSEAEEVILLNDFAKELDPTNPKSLIGKKSRCATASTRPCARYGALAARRSAASREQRQSGGRRPLASPWCARRSH